jgi:hypothetical protein
MPEISRFLGIVIAMYYKDRRRTFTRITETIRLKNRSTELHETELMDDWKLAELRKPLKNVEPLE